jgi:SnoaL-like protein
MTDAEAQAFADEWIAGWNSHDLDRILAHYRDDVTLSTPFVARLLGREGIVAGKVALRSFWSLALERFPDLTFTLYGAYAGAQSVVLNYRSVAGLAGAEFLRLDEHGRVIEVLAHYRPDERSN